MKFFLIAAAVLLYMHSKNSQPASSASGGPTQVLTPRGHIFTPFVPRYAPPGATMPGAFPVQAPGKANLGMGVLTSLLPAAISGGGVTGPTSTRGAGPARI